MKKISFINESGGLGKSSFVMNTAWYLSEQGKSVLIIDLDGQKANISYFLKVNKGNEIKTIFDLCYEKATIKETIQKVKDNLFIIPANNMAGTISGMKTLPPLKKALKEVDDAFDYVFFDVSPKPDWSHFLTLVNSDYVIVPMLPDVKSLEANKGITESLEEIQEGVNPNLKVLGIVFNKYTTRTSLSKEVITIAEKMAEKMNTTLFKSNIRQCVALSENIAYHKGITEYAPKSNGAKDYIAFVEEMEERING